MLLRMVVFIWLVLLCILLVLLEFVIDCYYGYGVLILNLLFNVFILYYKRDLIDN